jgi:hypothetical protein
MLRNLIRSICHLAKGDYRSWRLGILTTVKNESLFDKQNSRIASDGPQRAARARSARLKRYVALLNGDHVHFTPGFRDRVTNSTLSVGDAARRRLIVPSRLRPIRESRYPAGAMFSRRTDRFKELATIHRPFCQKCKHPMKLARTSPGAIGYQELTFDCSTCGRREIRAVAVDPLRTDAVGWLASELRPPR